MPLPCWGNGKGQEWPKMKRNGARFWVTERQKWPKCRGCASGLEGGGNGEVAMRQG